MKFIIQVNASNEKLTNLKAKLTNSEFVERSGQLV